VAIEITIRPELGRERVRGLRPGLRRAAAAALRHEKRTGNLVSLLLTNDEEMRALNRQWRGLDRTTDVLSFESGDETLGDVVVSLDQAALQAERLRVDLEEELARLVIHGTLHLLGHDHDTTAKRRAMNSLTEEILKSL
jgi:probable rRNA maturation factor